MASGAAGLFERRHELEAIRDRVDAAARGEGSACVVQGPAGVGKTALLAAARGVAVSAGLAVLAAASGLLEGDLAWNLVRQLFAAVIDAADAEREELLAGAAALAAGPLGLVERRRRTSGLHGLYWLTARLAERSPLMIAVDDAHWGDEPSLRFLAYLARRVQDLPVTLVMTERAGEPEPEPLQAIVAGASTQVIALSELGPAGSAQLTRQVLGSDAADEFCLACHEATNGNPFLLHELVTQLRNEGVEPSAAHAAEVRGVTPATVRRAVLLRLSRMSPARRELAAAVAVIGEDVRLADAAALAGLDRADAASAADELAAAAILTPGEPLSFIHPLVREAIYTELPPHERARRHRRAAEVLASEDADVQRVAAQLLGAEPEGDPWVVGRLREAATAALDAGAPGSAADLLARALREPPPPAERADVLAELGRSEIAAGRATAAERLREAVELTREPERRAQLRLDLGRLLYVSGDVRDAAEEFEAGQRELASAERDDPSLQAALVAAWLAAARLHIPLRPRAVEIMHEIAASPPRGGTHGERALLAQVAGQLVFETEPCEKAMSVARLALGDGELIRQETSDGMSWIIAASALGRSGDLGGYAAMLDIALEDARRRGSVTGFATASYAYGYVRYLRGELARAIADTQQAIDAEREGWRQFLIAARAQLAVALLDRGELEAAAAVLEPAGTEGSTMHSFVFEALALIRLARGEHRAALEAALEAGRIADEALVSNPAYMPWRSRAAVAAARLGDRERADAWVEEELALARRFGAPHSIGTALIAAGSVRGRDGVDALEEAVEVLGRSAARLEHARALVHLGIALRRAGKPKAARAAFQRGLDASAATGATALEDQARRELTATGARPRRRRITGTESLTPAELRVAELAAGGMSNREIAESLFVSLRTVETHLTHVYRKLEIGSRSGLARMLAGAEREPVSAI